MLFNYRVSFLLFLFFFPIGRYSKNFSFHHVVKNSLNSIFDIQIFGDDLLKVLVVLVSEFLHFGRIGEIDFEELDGVVRLGEDHGQREHAEDESDGLADSIIVDQFVERIVEVGDSLISNHAMQGFVIALQNFLL